MRKSCLTLIILLLISCQQSDWKTDLLKDISEYENSEKIEKKFSIKHNSGYDILIELFETNSNGLTKLKAEYKRKDLGNWKKVFILKNDKILYSSNMGIAPAQTLDNNFENKPKYFLIEKKVWFKNDNYGIEEIKELEMIDLRNIESKETELRKMESIISDLNNDDFRLLQIDYKALTE